MLAACSAFCADQMEGTTTIVDFEAAALPVAPNPDGGLPPAFQRSTEAPKTGTACMRLVYAGGSRWGNLTLPITMTGAETAVRFWLKRISADKGACMHIWLFENDGDAWLSRPVKVDALPDGWQQVEIPLTEFTFQPRGDDSQEMETIHRMLLGCNYANMTVELDDLSFVPPDPKQTWAARTSSPLEQTFDTARSMADWWGTLTAQYDPIQFMAESTSPNLGRRGMNESWWTVECERVRKMGLHGMRLWFQIDWWEPFHHTEIAGKDAGRYAGYDVDGPRMQSVYRFLDMCEKYRVEVLLNFGWKLDMPARYWLAAPGQIARSNPDINNAEAHAQSLVDLLMYLREVKKYTVVTHVTLGNEFEYNYPSLYEALHKRLVAEGLRDKYVLVGLESNQGIAQSHSLAAAHPEIFDVHSLHTYSTMNLGNLLAGDKAALRDLEAKGAGPRTTGTRGRVFYTEFALGPSAGIDIAGAVAGSAREGAYGAGGWRLADQHLVSVCDLSHGGDRFDHGLHQWGTWEWIPWMKKPRESYYATALLTRYTWPGSKVFTPVQKKVPNACVCFAKDGHFSILAVNQAKQTPRKLKLRFAETLKKPFYRHLFDRTALPAGIYDTIIPSDRVFPTSDIEDALPANTFAIYTTMPDWPQLELTPYVSTAKPGDTIPLKARKIAYDGTLRWSVDGGEANGTVADDGVYRAPKALPAIDPVIVRATGEDDNRAVGLAIISFSGQPTDPPSRPSVTVTPKVGRGSSRMFDLGTEMPLETERALTFEMTNYGSQPTPFTITTTAPWLKVAPTVGELAAGRAQTVKVTATVDTHGLKSATWYRAYINISSPRSLGHERLDVFFKTKGE